MITKIKSYSRKLSQIVYLTASFYFQNNLGIAASSCTFGFIFSFVPIMMLIVTSCIGILNAYPGIIEWIENIASQFGSIFNVEDFISKLSQGISVSGINIVLGFFIIWMARKLFLSIIQGMNSIFRKVAPPRPVINQLLTFAGELLLVIICAIVFFAAFMSRQIFTLPIFNNLKTYFPFVFSSISNNIVNIALYLILFIFTTVCYRVASGTKPKIRLCLLNSVLCNSIFIVIVYIITSTINKSNYSTIYGVLSNLMILLFEVWFFFCIFMIFAQAIYVEQFFDSLLIAELYVLPKHENMGIIESLKRLLFITPEALMNEKNMKSYNAGDYIYRSGDSASCVYYVLNGNVMENRNGNEVFYEKGDSFGEPAVILNRNRINDAVAVSDCSILIISSEDFADLIQKNPKAAAKAMSAISKFTKKMFMQN